MPEMVFQPSLHGWPFPNAFRFPPHMLGMNRPLPDTFGLCGGMCWSALDRFLDGRRIPRDCPAPGPGEALHAELILRQANALARDVWSRVLEWQRQPGRRSGAGSSGAATGLGREWRSLRRSLDAGEPALLCIILDGGPFATPGNAHQVLAYAYSNDRQAKHIRIRIYDPNHPDDDDRTLDLTLGRTGSPMQAALASHGTIHGFFVVPYDRAAPERLTVETVAEPGRVTLNHPILDRPTVLAGGSGSIDVLGRDDNDQLIRYSRGDDGVWERANLSLEAGADHVVRIHGRPAVTGSGRGINIFARNHAGDLLQYRRLPGLGWRVRNLTDDRRAGPPFRLASDPVAVDGPGRRTNVFGLDHEGRLVHYESAPVRGWAAAHPAEAQESPDAWTLEGRPVAALGPGDTLHVLGRAGDGRLLHFSRTSSDAPWSVAPILADTTNGQVVRITGDPALVVDDDLPAIARSPDGGLLHCRWTPDSGWNVTEITAARHQAQADTPLADSDPTAIAAGESLHVFVRGTTGGLLHARLAGDGRWSVEDLTHGRITIDSELTIDDAPVACAGAHDTLVVAASRGRELVLYTWRPETDWVAEAPAATRPDGFSACTDVERLTALSDDRGRCHIFATDSLGTIVHLEAAPMDRGAPGRGQDTAHGENLQSADASRAGVAADAALESADLEPGTPGPKPVGFEPLTEDPDEPADLAPEVAQPGKTAVPGIPGASREARTDTDATSENHAASGSLPGRRRSIRRPEVVNPLPELPLLDPHDDEPVGAAELPLLELHEDSIIDEAEPEVSADSVVPHHREDTELDD